MSGPVPVQAMGSGTTHLAIIPPNTLLHLRHFGAEYTGTILPITAVCGAVIGQNAGVVVLRTGRRLSCEVCRGAGESETGPRPGTVWSLDREGDEYQWLVVSLHASRASAVNAVPAGSTHRPAGPDADWDPLDHERWVTPRGNPWYRSELRISEWQVNP